MKTNTKATNPTLRNILSGVSLCVLLFLSIWAGPPSAYAANQTWTNAPVTQYWSNSLNWVGQAVPGDFNVSYSGATANGANNDIATFNTPLAGGIGGAANPIITADATVTNARGSRIGGITFDTANCGAYVIWSPSSAQISDGTSTFTTGYLYVGHTNAIQITPTVVNSQAVIVPLLVSLPSSTPGIYNLINNSTTPGVTLTINSITHAGATTRATTFVLDGSNTGNNTVTNLSEGTGNGTGGITKQGAGTWIIQGPCTFPAASPLNINGGLLAIEDPASFGLATSATITSNATLRVDNITPNTQSFAVNRGGTLLVNGSATINGLSMANNIAANNGTIATTSATNLVQIGNTLNKFTGGTIDSVLHISGPGTIEFVQTATFAGNISVDSGTNQINQQLALGNGPNLNVGPGGTFDTTPVGVGATYTLDTKAFSATGTGTVVGSTAANVSADPAGIIDFGSKPISLTFKPAGSAGDTGHPALYCSAGTLAFHGNAVTVNNASGSPLGAGTYQLVLQASGAISSSGAFVALMSGSGLQPGMIAEIQTAGAELDLVVSAYTPKSLTWIGNDPLLPAEWDRQVSTNWLNGATATTFNIYDSVTFNATGAAAGTVSITNVMQPTSLVVDTSGGGYTFNNGPGSIGQIAGATSLLKVGSGTLVLGAANTYSGGTVISNGVIQLAIDEGVSSTGAAGANDFAISNLAVLDLNGHVNTLNGLNGSGTIDTTANGGSATLNFGQNGDGGLFTGQFKNSSGTLSIVKNGLGTETITSSNSYVGATIINGGTLRVSNTFALGAGNSPVTINNGTLDMDTNLIVTNLNGQLPGAIVNSSAFTNTLTVENGGDFGGLISGKIALFISSGTLLLSNANTYSNGTIVAAGAGLSIAQGTANPGPGTVIASNNVTIGMPAAVSASSTFSPPITTVDGATVTFTSGETANTWGNAFNGTSLATNIFSGGNMTIGGSLTFSNFPSTVIITNGQVRWNNASPGGDNTTFVFQGTNSGCFSRDSSDVIHLGALFGNGLISMPSVTFPATYWIGAKGIDSVYSGMFVGSNNLVKVGAGKLTLNGEAITFVTDNATFTNNVYGSALTNIGFTTISNGVLALTAPNDLTASPTITLANPTAILDATSMGFVSNFLDGGGNADSAIYTNGLLTVVATTELTGLPQVLGGVGAVKGNGVTNNGTISPGFSGQGGTLSISNALTVNANATNAFGLSDDPTGLVTPSGVLNVGGTVTLSGNSIVSLSAYNGFINPGKYTLLKYGSLVNESGPVSTGPIPNFTLGGTLPTSTRANLVLSNGTGEVDLVVSSLNTSNLVWVGGQNNNAWDINTSGNWNSGSASGLTFFQQDFVTFDITAGANTNVVTLSNSVAPTTITVNGAEDYIFGGTGNVIGDTSLTLNGPGFLLLTNAGANTFHGGIVVNGGILKAGLESGGNQNDLALGTGSVTVNANAELRFGGNTGGVVNHFITNAITINGGTNTAADGAQHLTNSTVTVAAGGATFRTQFSTKNLVLDSPLVGPGNLSIVSVTTGAAGQVILNNSNNTISGTITIATNGNLALTGFAGLSNAPTINVQQGGILDFTAKSNQLWAVVTGQTAEGSGAIRGKNLTVNAGGTIAPGTIGTIGTLTVTNTLAPGTNYTVLTLNGTTSMDINRGSTPNADLILNAKGTNNFGGTLNVNNVGAALQLGDTFTLFNSFTNLGTFSTINLPALSSGLAWNNTLAVNGKITVVSGGTIAPTVSAVITNFSLSQGTNIVLNGNNAQSGATYYLITSPNVAAPLNQWKTIGTNVGAGTTFSFTGTNAVNSILGKQFYLLSSTNYNP